MTADGRLGGTVRHRVVSPAPRAADARRMDVQAPTNSRALAATGVARAEGAVRAADGGSPFQAWLDGALRRVAPISPWATKLLSMSPDADGNDRWLRDLIASDPALVARVLGTANSRVFNPQGHPVNEVGHAIRRLGTREVWRVATVLALGASSRIRPELRSAKRALWMHSFTAAHASRRVIECSNRAGLDPDRAYLAALLHDIGLMVLLSVEPQRCLDMLARVGDPAVGFSREVELEVGLPPHAQIGAEVCRRWGLPEDIVVLVGGHGVVHPLDHPVALQGLAAAMALGHQVAEREIPTPGLHHRERELDDAPLLRTFLRLPEARLGQVHQSVREAAPRIAQIAESA